VTARLLRAITFHHRAVALAVPAVVRAGSPLGCSTLSTSAPMSPRQHRGDGSRVDRAHVEHLDPAQWSSGVLVGRVLQFVHLSPLRRLSRTTMRRQGDHPGHGCGHDGGIGRKGRSGRAREGSSMASGGRSPASSWPCSSASSPSSWSASAGVSLAQEQIDFRARGRRVLSAARPGARPVLRQALCRPSGRRPCPGRADRGRRAEPVGVSFVEIADADGVVVATRATRAARHSRRTGRGRSWVGDARGRRAARSWRTSRCFGDTGPQTGRVVARRGRPEYPSLARGLLSAVPNLLLPRAAGSSGSPARCSSRAGSSARPWVLEPVEIRGLVEHREAMLTGSRRA
jgi:hypothetical protein